MIYFIIILTVIIGISFILWYANRQDMNHDAPESSSLNGDAGDSKNEIVKEILTVFKELFDTHCEIYHLDNKLHVFRMIRSTDSGEYKELGFQINTDKRCIVSLDKSFENNKNDLLQVLDILKNGVKKYRMNTLLIRDIKSEWFFNGEMYVDPSTYNQVIFGEFKARFKYDLSKELYTKEELDQFKPSEDPRKIHWKEFLEADMKAKKQREIHCHKYVDEVIQKQVDYNDLQLNWEMLPSAPITDVESFRNFCKVVHEDAKYEDYEIQNYLLLKKSMQ